MSPESGARASVRREQGRAGDARCRARQTAQRRARRRGVARMAEISSPGRSAVSSADGGVQSLERAFLLLELMAEDGGEVALSRLPLDNGLPLSPLPPLGRPPVAP